MAFPSRSDALDRVANKAPRHLYALGVCALFLGCGTDSASSEAASGNAGMSGATALMSPAGAAGSGATAGAISASGTGGSGPTSAGSSGANSATAGSAGSLGGASGGGAGTSAGAAGMTQSAGSGGSGASSGGASGAGGAAVNQDNLPATTLHLAGDSTVMYYAPPSAQEGWGQELGQYFIGKVMIDNQALGGSSVQTFHDGSRWSSIMSSLKAGDYVMADFGINDSGSVAGRSVTPENFQKIMLQMRDQVKVKQATFIIVTPSALQYWSGGMETNARLAPYVAVETTLGSGSQIPIADLNARSLEFLNMIGQSAAMEIYINGDKAHFTKAGATQMAKFVAAELRRIGNPLANYLK